MQEQLDLIVSKWSKTFALLSKPYLPLEPGTYRVCFNKRMRSRAGVCMPHESLIQINPHLAKTPELLEEIIVHEMCHLAVARRFPYARAHGQKWQKLMAQMGYVPKRCHEIPVEKRNAHRRWQAYCPCQTHSITTVLYNRLRKGARYQCVKCRKLLLLKPYVITVSAAQEGTVVSSRELNASDQRKQGLPLFKWLKEFVQ